MFARCIRRTKGYSLLEVVLASAICTTALVTALAILREGVSNAGKIDTRHLMLIYGVSKMEEQLAVVAASWATGTLNGDFASDGFADIRFTATRTDNPASGGITNQLMSISVTVYSDDDSDDTLDANEMQSIFTTKIGKMANYESMAGS
ncbi:MAG: hypothetical protein WD669_11720 [Pirellulales bacterium]